MRDINDDENITYNGMRRLAAEVLKLAIIDYNETDARIQEERPFFWQPKDKSPAWYLRQLKRDAYAFLTDNTLWHQILDINPEFIKQKLMDGTLVIDYRHNNNQL